MVAALPGRWLKFVNFPGRKKGKGKRNGRERKGWEKKRKEGGERKGKGERKDSGIEVGSVFGKETKSHKKRQR